MQDWNPGRRGRVAERGRDRGREMAGHGAAGADNATAGRETGPRRCSQATASGYVLGLGRPGRVALLEVAWV